MVRRQHTGRPDRGGVRRPTIPADWAHAPAVVVARSLPSTVQIGPAGGSPEWTPGRRQTHTAALAAVYTGPASIMPAALARAATVVEDDVTTAAYDITVALTRTGADLVEAGHTVLVTACDDASLVGARLYVRDAERGSRRFSRVLLATLTT